MIGVNMNPDDFKKARKNMVESQAAARGISDVGVLGAMMEIPREEFLPEEIREHAYLDRPLPIGEGQTISQPYIVAVMLQALQIRPDTKKVLEVGAGSGYAAALLSKMVPNVYGIERHERLFRTAAKTLERLKLKNVELKMGDGTLGWPEYAPFERILVSAGAPDVPRALMQQLCVGGHLVMPVGDHPRAQQLVRVTRRSEVEFIQENLEKVMFVPLVGEQGWGTERE